MATAPIIEQSVITMDSGTKILVETRTVTNTDGSKSVSTVSFTAADLTAAQTNAAAVWTQRLGVINGTTPPLAPPPASA